MIRTLQADEHQRGCLMEELVLKGDLAYESRAPDIAQGFFGLFSVFQEQNRIFLPKKHHLFLRISRARARLGPC